jgi:carbohydrate kinase (thermoresistant glucokinase family)
MGVSGCGKSSIARDLSDRMGWAVLEGDSMHPPANVAKMSSGTPLDDADRRPWLAAIAAAIDSWQSSGQSRIVTCSALKRAYREVLIGGRPHVRLVYLRGSRALIGERMAARKGHFMPTALLDSQFTTLQPPGPDEHPIIVDIDPPIARIVAEIAAQL